MNEWSAGELARAWTLATVATSVMALSRFMVLVKVDRDVREALIGDEVCFRHPGIGYG